MNVAAMLSDEEGNTALHFAAKTGHTPVLQLLLSRSIKPAEVLLVIHPIIPQFVHGLH